MGRQVNPRPHSHHYHHHNHCHHLTKSIDAITVKLHHGVLLSARTTSKQYIFCRVHSWCISYKYRCLMLRRCRGLLRAEVWPNTRGGREGGGGEGKKKWNPVCKMVSNLPPTLPFSPTRSNLSSLLLVLNAAIISFRLHTLVTGRPPPCDGVASNDGAITAMAVMDTYSLSSNNDE